MGRWRKLYNVEHHNFYPSPNTIIVIKLGKMSWFGYAYKKLIAKPEGKHHSEDLCIDGRIIV
jgi:hypothetical protein